MMDKEKPGMKVGRVRNVYSTREEKRKPLLIGLAGHAGAGKDTLADMLVEHYGFDKFSFSDGLYREVSSAFGVTEYMLRKRATKETPTQTLAINRCYDSRFVLALCLPMESIGGVSTSYFSAPRSPRWILQRWGTAYRRAQDPDYWLKQSQAMYDDSLDSGIRGLVSCAVRFQNEASWIKSEDGIIVRLSRGTPPEDDYVSEVPLEHQYVDCEIDNDRSMVELLEHAHFLSNLVSLEVAATPERST